MLSKTMSEETPKPLTDKEKQQMIAHLIWAFSLSNIVVTEAEAEAALERVLKRPLPDI